MVQIMEQAGGRVLEIHLSGRLARNDYQHFAPEVDRQIREHGRISLLVRLRDFHGWTASGLWADIRFAMRHFSDFERIAFIGEAAWQRGMAAVCKPFTAARVHYFDTAHDDEARAWVAGEREVRAA